MKRPPKGTAVHLKSRACCAKLTLKAALRSGIMMQKVRDAMKDRGINLREDWLKAELVAMSELMDLHQISTVEATGRIFTKLLLCNLNSEQCLATFTINETSSQAQPKIFQVENMWNISDHRFRLEDGSYTQPALGHVNKLLLTDGKTNVLAYDFNGLLKAYQSKFPILRGCKVLLQNAEMQQGAYILESKTACFLGGCIPDSLEEDVRPLNTLQSSAAVVSRQEPTTDAWNGSDAMEVDIAPFPITQQAKPEPRLTDFTTLLNSHNHTKKGWIRCFAARLHHLSVSAASRLWEVIVELHDGAGGSAIARLHPTLAVSKLGTPPSSSSFAAVIEAKEVKIMQQFTGIFLVSVIAPAQQQQSKLAFEVIEEAIDTAPFLQIMQQRNSEMR